MKKIVVMILALCISLASFPALAESADGAAASFSGTVSYRESITVLAPFGGALQDYSLHAGDEVKAGQELFQLTTTKVYAPFDGTVRGLRAQAGDEAQGIVDRYGALAYVEPVGKYTISATTNNAYKTSNNNNVNRYLNEGETVYLKSSDDAERTGVGVITKVEGRTFQVEVQQSNLNLEDTVSIFRDTAFSTAHRLGSSAKVTRAAATPVTAQGSVLRVAVSEGATVLRGDLLFEMVTGTLQGLQGAEPSVVSPVDGVVLSVANAAGTQVEQWNVLATLYAKDALWVQFDVDETDLGNIKAGDKVSVKMDALPDAAALEGTVESVSALGTEAKAASYTAYVSVTDTANLRTGMNVSVYLQ